MRTKFTLIPNKLFSSLFLLALLAGITSVRAQAPFSAGLTYYVDGSGNDVVAPKDTFANLTGAYTTGNPYTSATGLISALNANGIDPNTLGQITILLAPGYSGSENSNTGIVVNTIAYASALRTIVMKPAPGVNVNITTSVALTANNALFRLNGTQYFIIDGEGTPGQRNLTFTVNAASAANTHRVIDLIATSTAPINTVTVRNVNIRGNATASAVTTYAGVYIGGAANATSSVRRNANISVINCDIQGVQFGVYARGIAATARGNQDIGLIVRNNTIGGTALVGGTANAAGILLSNQANAFIEYNTISRNLNTQTGFRGIELSNIASTISLDSNIVVNGNTIHNLHATSGGTIGIRVGLGNHQYPLELNITNNTIAKLTGPGNSTINSLTYPIGILVEDSTINGGLDIINNSVALTGATLNGSASACLVTGTLTAGGLRVYNNIFSNKMENLLTSTASYQTYAVIVARSQTGTEPNYVVVEPFDSIDNNLYEVTTTGGWANVGYTSLNNYTSVDEWAAYTGYDKGSFTTRAYFDNDSTLAINNGAPTTYAASGRALLAKDILNNNRPSSSSSVGAYEFTQNTTNALAPLMGGATYSINGVNNFPTNANPTVGSFASYGSFVNHLNSFGTQGTGTINIVFNTGWVNDATVPPAILPYPGMLGTRPIVVSVANGVTVNLTIAGGQTICANSAIVKLYGASFFEINGSDGNGGRALTVSLPTSANSATAKLVALVPTISKPVSSVSIRWCNLIGSSSTTTTNTLAAVYMGAAAPASGTASAVGGANVGDFIGNNVIEAVRYGIYWRGKAGQTDQFITIYRNMIGGSVAPGGSNPTTYLGGTTTNLAAIYVKGISQSLIDSNVVRNSIPTVSGYRGIELDGTTNETGRPQTVNVTRNTIYNLGATTGYAVGIRIAISEANRSIIVANNIIAKIYGTGSNSVAALGSPTGIAIESPNTASGVLNMGISLIHNTVHLSQHPIVQVASGNYSTALYMDARISGVASINNIYSNTSGRTSGAVSNAYAIAVGGTQVPFSQSNTNVYYTGANSNFTNNQIGVAGTTQFLSLFELRQLYQTDASSLFGEVPFLNDTTSAMDLMYVGHIAKRYVRNNLAVEDIAGTGRGTGDASAGALEIPKNYSPLVGGGNYQVNGVMAPPLTGSNLTGSFNTINNLFRYINTNGVDDDNPPMADINVEITNGYAGEGDTLISTLYAYPKMSGNRIIKIKVATGANPIIASTAATTRSQFAAAASVIRFQGAGYVEIDGSNDGGVTRNLTIRLPQNPANATFVNNGFVRVIDVIGWEKPVIGLKIQNCNILGYSTNNSIATFAGVYQGGVAFTSTTPVPSNPIRSGNNRNEYVGNFIGAVKYGIYLKGANNVTAGQDLNAVVRGNRIGGDSIAGSVPTDYFGGVANAAGILVAHQAQITIDSNVIRNNMPGFTANSGIELSNAGIPTTGQWNTDENVTITRNTITNIRSSAATAYGIYTNIRWDGTKSINIYNNMISGIAAAGTIPTTNFALNPYGIFIDGTPPVSGPIETNLNINIWNNSINLGQAATMTTGISACVATGANTRGGITMTNNILQNRLSRTAAGGTIYVVAIAGTIDPFVYTDFNNYFVAGTTSTNAIGGVNLSGTVTNYTTLANWASFTSQDTLSMSFAAPFTSDVNLLIPNGTSSPLYRAGQRVPVVNNDILAAPRPGLASGVSTIGAHEFIGSYQDIFRPIAYDYTVPSEICFDGTPILINARIADKSPVVSDTLYYRINNGTEIGIVASTKNGAERVYTIPAQPRNTYVAYRIGGVDGGGNAVSFINADPRSGYNYATTIITINNSGSLAVGFDEPNTQNWTSQQISGTGQWDLRSFGSLNNPVLAPLTGSRVAMLSVPNGTAARLVSTCLDLSSAKRPTLRMYISQNADNAGQRDSIVVKAGGFGIWVDIAKGYPIYRANASFAVPGYKVYDVCLEDYTFDGIKVAIEAYSKGGGNILIDSVVIFDNFLSLPILPKTQSTCFNDSVNITIPNADDKFQYTLYDMLTGRFIGPTFVGNGGTLIVQGYMSTVDSAHIRVHARNLTSNCENFMDDTAIVYFRTYKGGPFVVKGSTFNGEYNAGDLFTPDAIKVGGQGRYQIVPPAGTTRANYGTAWTVANVSMYKYFFDQVTNTNVIVDSARSFTLVAPTPSTDGYIQVNGTGVDSNKTFVMEVTIRILPEGCDSVVSRYVTIANGPVASFSVANDTLCANTNYLFSNQSSTGAFTLPMQFGWDFGDGTSSAAGSPVKSYSTPGTYRARLAVRNNTTLLDSVWVNIVVLPSPVADFTSTLSCAGKASRFTSTGPHSAGNFYRFSIGGQVADSNVVDAIVQGSDTTINTTLFVRNSVGCTDTVTKPIQVFAQPSASFTAQNVCAGAAVKFTNSSTIDAGKNGRINEFGSEWSFGNNQIGYSNSPSYFYNAGGDYWVKLTVISNYGCTDTFSRMVSVYDKPVINYTVDNTCKGSNLIIANNTTYSGGNDKLLYTWKFGDNSFPKTERVPTHAYGATGSYFITLVVTDTVHNCIDSVRATAIVKDRAIADFSASNGCVGKPVNFTNLSIAPPAVTPTYTYLFGDNNTGAGPDASHSYLTGGNKDVKLIVNVDGCRDTASKTINISSAITVSYIIEKLDSNTAKFTANRTGMALYSWNFGDGTPVVNTTQHIINHVFDRKGYNVVTLTIQDANACDAVYVDSLFIDRRVGGKENELEAKVNFNVYPNPFNTSTKVSFDLDNSENVKVEVYDLVGRKVFTKDAGNLSAGAHSIDLTESQFDAKSAVYMVRVYIGDDVITRQIVKQ